jgi:hypothetical protein
MESQNIVETKRLLRVLESRISDLFFMSKRLGDEHPLVAEALGEVRKLCRDIGQD